MELSVKCPSMKLSETIAQRVSSFVVVVVAVVCFFLQRMAFITSQEQRLATRWPTAQSASVRMHIGRMN